MIHPSNTPRDLHTQRWEPALNSATGNHETPRVPVRRPPQRLVIGKAIVELFPRMELSLDYLTLGMSRDKKKLRRFIRLLFGKPKIPSLTFAHPSQACKPAPTLATSNTQRANRRPTMDPTQVQPSEVATVQTTAYPTHISLVPTGQAVMRSMDVASPSDIKTCSVCGKEFPARDQRGFRNPGFTYHQNKCVQREAERKAEEAQHLRRKEGNYVPDEIRRREIRPLPTSILPRFCYQCYETHDNTCPRQYSQYSGPIMRGGWQ
ncbi:hypothetical protein BC936DRAFT_141950 [Jimgerdemannia flammicorona]|uniref:Uncharacterized protein n=2 Tax=Jimgerdemannia flammicorona TaxID=994334 RepID=A0A433DFM2_9FUNG|nr:hypothetical protein BC936DRAFT_141950 [Jimgerdemannia flammicorona]RUS31226.1 hypothetical protein BC938DRAFT_478227 [Jimgerdemannia flammicorona]